MSVTYKTGTRIFAGALVLIQFGSLAAITFLAMIDFSTSYWAVNIGLIAIAGYLIITAYKSLKPSLTVNPIPKEGATFIQVGIYRRLRHPMYVAVLLYAFGAAGFSTNKAAIVICGILAIGIVVKAKLEDNLLLKAHPEAWEYQMSTPGFIPCRCETLQK
jgi:protein-S-isoprenylcysteine O-methyltransferase Ste14